jgi:hypothetical protein
LHFGLLEILELLDYLLNLEPLELLEPYFEDLSLLVNLVDPEHL